MWVASALAHGHAWTEPVERLIVAAEAAGIGVAVPRPGETIGLPPPPVVRWWPAQPWERAEEAPVVSSGLAPQAAAVE